MFKTFHRQMTFFCTLITAIILIFMTLTCLYISESGIKKNGYTSFLNDVHSMVANIENQSLISYEWLSKMENGGKYIISLTNNGLSILYDDLKENGQREQLIQTSIAKAQDIYAFSFEQPGKTMVITQTHDFTLTDDSKNQYYVSVAGIPKTNGYIGAVIIYPLLPQKIQITQQRILFAAINLFAVLLLGIFSYFFTSHMLLPLKKNREQQAQFIASASHELRTPLAVILSSLSALKKADGEEKERFSLAIQSESSRMSRLVDDLLLLASADDHSWNLHLEKVEMDTLLLDIYEKFESIAAKQNVSLSIELPQDMSLKCLCDMIRIEQVLSILVDNAISYTPKGGGIILKIKQRDSRMIICVTDNGPGIADIDKKQIFERFYRAEKSRTQKTHYGLGLCIAKEIIKLHKGKIWIDDTPGGGATFVIQLPIHC